MNINRILRKIYWYTSSRYAAFKCPINKRLTYIGVTGTDGKTTTSSFIYELAKEFGYRPLLLSTVSAKFDDVNIETELKSTSFFAYSMKNLLRSLVHFHIKGVLKNLFLRDRTGYEEHKETHRTTPLAYEIRKLIREYEKKGADLFILESTSHALDQYRVLGIEFDAAVYTNITNEHLDYHGSWKNYATAKSRLISQLKKGGIVVLNKDDQNSYQFLAGLVNKIAKKKDLKGASYRKEGNDLDLKNFYIDVEAKQRSFNVVAKATSSGNSYKTGINLFGDYNIYNALAAFSALVGLLSLRSQDNNENLSRAAKALSNLKEVEGRMNFISEDPRVIVDFAHTPNAFDKSLSSVKKLKNEEGRLWVIFGTAGLRDKYKRPDMGRIAYIHADNLLITSEDPRTESLFEINNNIISGFKNNDEDFVINTYYDGLKYEPEEGCKYIARFDEPNLNSRRNAIKYALDNASKEDLIIILGKGHETTMCYGEKEFEWNDINEVKKMLEERSK